MRPNIFGFTSASWRMSKNALPQPVSPRGRLRGGRGQRCHFKWHNFLRHFFPLPSTVAFHLTPLSLHLHHFLLKLLFRIFRFIWLLFLLFFSYLSLFLVFSLAIDPLQALCLGLSPTLLAWLPGHLDFNLLLCDSLFVSVTFDSFWRLFNSMPGPRERKSRNRGRSVVIFMFILWHNFRRFTLPRHLCCVMNFYYEALVLCPDFTTRRRGAPPGN